MFGLLLDFFIVSNQQALKVEVTTPVPHRVKFVQIVTRDPDLPHPDLQDSTGTPLTLPYLDPPLGGYKFQEADAEVFYWDYHETCQTSYCKTSHLQDDKATFYDRPALVGSGAFEFALFVVEDKQDTLCPLAQVNWTVQNHIVQEAKRVSDVDLPLLRRFVTNQDLSCS